MGGREPGGVLEVLDPDGDAGERSGVAAGCDDLVDALGLLKRPLGIDGDEGVDRGVECLDALEGMGGQGDGGAPS